MRAIQTARLEIRRFVEADLALAARLLDECFGADSLDARREWLRWTVQNYLALERLKQPPYGDYAVSLRDGGELVGSVGLVQSFGPFETLPSLAGRLNDTPAGRFTAEMGLFWAVAAKHRRKGYASEAARALAGFAFDELTVDRLVATTEHSNAASIAVMRRLGMRVERNPLAEPAWFQTVGVLFNPGRRQ